jgi:SAM-dependent methyltransferase
MDSWEEAVLWLKSRPDSSALVQAAFFDDPVSLAASRYYDSAEWRAIRSLLPSPPGSALEIGAGRGIASYALAMDGWEVTALEPDPSNVVGLGAIRDLIKETGVSLKLICDWGESLTFEADSFDIILCRQVLHHARDLRALCREIHRVLRPGGKLYAVREHVLSRNSDLEKFLNAHPLHHRYGGEHAYLLREYIEAIESAGLIVEAQLNPFQSVINTYPQSLEDIRRLIAARLHIPAAFVPEAALSVIGALSRSPGRLYSFVGRKRSVD